jgi:hypothetical protein
MNCLAAKLGEIAEIVDYNTELSDERMVALFEKQHDVQYIYERRNILSQFLRPGLGSSAISCAFKPIHKCKLLKNES